MVRWVRLPHHKYRLCGGRHETINHIKSEWIKLEQKEYKSRHDWARKGIYGELCNRLIFKPYEQMIHAQSTSRSGEWDAQTFLGFWDINGSLHHHHHHVVLPARISLTLSRHFSLSFIASGRSSGLHPVSSHSCCMYVRAGSPAFARPYVGSIGVHHLWARPCFSSSVLQVWFV